MQILSWLDRREPRSPRVVMQRGDCDAGQCGQFSVSISDGERGVTVRFADRAEFEKFLARGELHV